MPEGQEGQGVQEVQVVQEVLVVAVVLDTQEVQEVQVVRVPRDVARLQGVAGHQPGRNKALPVLLLHCRSCCYLI